MISGSEGSENVRFKHKKTTLKKNLRYIYVNLMFFHFKDHL
jgi:hypothetical protein